MIDQAKVPGAAHPTAPSDPPTPIEPEPDSPDDAVALEDDGSTNEGDPE